MLRRSLSEQFEAVAARYADRAAVKTGERALSYGELNATANRLARAILDRAGSGRTVGLQLEHGVSLSLGVLGCLKAGKAYVPLELAGPPERQARILADAEATVLVTDAGAGAPPGGGVGVLRLDALSSDLAVDDPGVRLGPDDLACVLYTSGSTGMPKGVMYMIPSVFVLLDALPLLPNDKVDRQALPDPPRDVPCAPAPVAGAMEALLLDVFADVLGAREVGVHDDFFALGGDSLQAGQIVSRLRAQLALEVPLATILARPTVSELAVAVVDLIAHSADPNG